MHENNSSTLGWFLAGLGLGAIAAILYAPKSGADTRKEIAHQLKHRRDDIMERGAEAREQVSNLVNRGKAVLDRKGEQVASAIDAGREAVHEATRKG